MTPDRWIVTVLALACVAFIVWFFWIKRARGVAAAVNAAGYQELMVLVKGGYTPDTILVRSGKPVRLNFRREETAACSELVQLPAFNRSARLPQGETVPVEFKPETPGEYEFTCQMGMYRGRLIVE